MTFLAILLAKFLDPVAIILGILNGYMSHSRVILVALSAAIAVVVELLLSATQVTRQFSPAELAIGFVAALAWSGLVFSIRKSKRAAEPEKPE
jgi:hypothetical protein